MELLIIILVIFLLLFLFNQSCTESFTMTHNDYPEFIIIQGQPVMTQ